MYCRTNNYTYTTYWLILHQLPKTQASNSVPMIDSHFYNSFAWIESNFFHSDCHFSWAWPVSHAHYIRSHSRMGSLRMRLVSRMQLSVNSLYTRSSVSDLLWITPPVGEYIYSLGNIRYCTGWAILPPGFMIPFVIRYKYWKT